MSEVKNAHTYVCMLPIKGQAGKHVTFEVLENISAEELQTIVASLVKATSESKMKQVSIQTDGKGLDFSQKRAQAANPNSFSRSNKNGTITGDLSKNPLRPIRVMLIESSEIAKLRKTMEPLDSKRCQRTMCKGKYVPHMSIKQWSEATSLAPSTVLTSSQIVIRNITDRSQKEIVIDL
jgi:hypothetical protein